MDLTIYTYGYYEAIYQVLNAVAMIRNSAFYMALIETASLLTLSYYVVKGAFLAGSGGYKSYITKAIGMMLVIQLLLLPKVPMFIKDNIERKVGKVDNIPIAFAVPVGIIENFGNILSMVFEQAFAPVEALGSGGITQSSYYKYGSVFSARLKKELSQSRIRDPEFLENMRNFHKRCIILPAMIGYQFTPQELFASKNMWKLVKDKAGTLTRIDMRVGKTRTTMNCKEAVDVFENYFNDEIVTIVNKNINKVFGRATNSNLDTSRATAVQLSEVFFSNIKANYSEVRPAQETLKQHMMINFMKDSSLHAAYGSTRAKMQQESSALISSDRAQESLPMLLVIFKCLVMVAFIFVVPAMIMSGGMKAFTTYLKIFVSLQLWPAINSVLNMIMVLYSNLSPESNLLVTYSTASTIENTMDSIVTIAGNLQYAIPMLSYYIVSSSSNAMANLAGSLSGSISSAASMAAGEVTTGNRSFDNINEGNLTKNMRNANKTDYNQSYVSGEIRQQLSDGTAKTTHVDGTSTYIPPEPQANFNLSTATQAHVSQGLTNSVAEHDQKQATYSEAQSNTMAKSTAYLANLIERQHAGETLGIDTTTKEGQDLSKMVEAGVREYKNNGHDKTQAASTTLQGGINGKLGWGGGGGSKGADGGGEGFFANAKNKLANYAVGKVAGALLPDTAALEVNAALDFKGSADSTSKQGIGEEGHHSDAVNVKKNLEVIENAANGKGWGKEISHDQTKATEVRGAFTQEKTAREEVAISAQKVKDYQEAVSQSATVTGTSDKNMKHQIIKQLTKDGWGGDSAAKMVNNGHPEAQRVFKKIVAAQVSGVNAQINQRKDDLSDKNVQKRLNEAEQENKSKITPTPDPLIDPKDNPTTANFNNIPQQIENQENTLGETVKGQKNNATTKIETAEQNIALVGQELQGKIKVEDKKSVTNKWYGKALGIGRQNDKIITSKTLNELASGGSNQFTAESEDSVTPGNTSSNAGKGGGQGAVTLSTGNNSVTGIPTTQVEETPSHINPRGGNNGGKGGVETIPVSVTNTNLPGDEKTAEVPVANSNSNVGGNRPEPSPATKGGGGKSSTSNPSATAREASTGNTPQPESGEQTATPSSNEAVLPNTGSTNAQVQQEAGNGSNKQRDEVDLTISKDSNNQDAFAPKKPTEVNLSNLQKAERKNEQGEHHL